MKATGIVRRIDDLGRVVIPKEIRRTMRIREGDPLEIYTDREGEVIFKKYSPIGELGGFAGQYAETLNRTAGLSIVIADRDAIIATAGVSKKEFSDRKVSAELERIMEERAGYFYRDGDELRPVAEHSTGAYLHGAMPIVAEGDVIGAVASVFTGPDDKIALSQDIEQKLIQTAAAFLGRQLEG